jgi:hypothetical protein
VIALVDNGIELVAHAVADEHRALGPQRHFARQRQAARPDLDLEAGRQLDVLDRDILGRRTGELRQMRMQGRAFLLLVAALGPCRRRRRGCGRRRDRGRLLGKG